MAIIAQCARCNLFLNLKKHPDECPHCGASFKNDGDKEAIAAAEKEGNDG
jgi:Zn finger protein HypA/HybF involved in hydrogenase expression